MSDKRAPVDHPIHPLLSERSSPYAFLDRPVSETDLRSIFEAARWAPSSFNEQPWSYIVATKAVPEGFERLLSCLTASNQLWAKAAPVLALGVVRLKLKRNDKLNRHASHDLGLASAFLVVEAASRGLSVHQMAGILPDRAREIYGIPEGFEAWTGFAIGTPGDPATLPDALRDRASRPRVRKPQSEFVFGERWGKPWTVAGECHGTADT